MRPDPSLLALEEDYVRLLIVNFKDADVGRFDFDFDTTFAVFALNHKGQIYTRFGARDSRSAESFVSPAALEDALAKGLALHERWKAGEFELPPAPPSKSAQSYEFVRNQSRGGGRCIHCHDVASGRALELLESETFSKMEDIWIYPEPVNLGLHLNKDDGNILTKTEGAAWTAGLKEGDRLVKVADRVTSTYADVQYALHRVSADTSTIPVVLEDGREVALALPEGWRHSDISWRRLGLRLSPAPGFGGTPLEAEKRKELDLPLEGLATKVSFFDVPQPEGSPLKEGDIIVAVNDAKINPITENAALHLSLDYQAGDTVKVDLIRRGEPLTVALTLQEPPPSYRRIMDASGKHHHGTRGGKGEKKRMRRGAE